MKQSIDIEDLIKNPAKFAEISLDAKYMCTLMLSTWIQENAKKTQSAMGLIDAMTKQSREFLVLICKSMQEKKLLALLKDLVTHDPKYKDLLTEIVVSVKQSIKLNT